MIISRFDMSYNLIVIILVGSKSELNVKNVFPSLFLENGLNVRFFNLVNSLSFITIIVIEGLRARTSPWFFGHF